MLKRIACGRDAILIELPTAERDWSPDTEPRLQVQNYSTTFRHFLANGIASGRSDAKEECQESAQDIVDSFDDEVSLQYTVNNHTKAHEIHIIDRRNGKTVLRLRRYRFDSFVAWIARQGFKILFSEMSQFIIDRRFGMGVVLVEFN